MKTAKIAEVKQVKPHNGKHGLIYYHLLVLDNGEKIEIGKKSPLKEGYEVNYEIVGDPGQHEFTKAKAVQAQAKTNYSTGKSNNASFSLAYAKDLAVAHIEQGKEFKTEQILQVATAFNNWLKSN